MIARKWKPIVCLLLAVTVNLGSISHAASVFAEDDSGGASAAPTETISKLYAPTALKDVALTDTYAEEILRMTGLGIIEASADGYFKADEKITRAEMIQMVVKAAGLDNQAVTMADEVIFSDIPQGSTAAGYVNAAYANGIVNGMVDHLFEPDEAATVGQAVKALICSLKYGASAELRGGFPTGYLAVADDLDIITGIDTNLELTRGTMAAMIDRTVTVPALKPTSMSGNTITYSQDKDNSFLRDKWNIYYVDSVVTGNEFTSLTSSAYATKIGGIEVGGHSYSTNLKDMWQLIGESLRVYIKEDDLTGDTVVYYEPNRQTGESVSAAYEEIDSGSLLNGTIRIIESETGKKKNCRIDSAAKILYNNVYYGKIGDSVVNNALLEPADKCELSIELTDNDNDNDYDVVKIKNSYDLSVDKVNAGEGVVYLKPYHNSFGVVELSEETDDYRFRILFNGAEISIAEIAEWDTLQLQISKDGRVKVAEIARGNTSGTIESCNTDEREVNIGGKQYKVSVSLNMDDFKLNKTGRFYLDSRNKISGYNFAETSSTNYAIVISAYIDESGADGFMHLIDSSGTMTNYKLASKVKCGEATQKSTAVVQSLNDRINELLVGESTLRVQLIQYKTNTSGEISEIKYPIDNSNVEGYKGYDKYEFSLDYKLEGFTNVKNDSEGIYGKAALRRGIIGSKYDISSAIVFYVPDVDYKFSGNDTTAKWAPALTTEQKRDELRDPDNYYVGTYEAMKEGQQFGNFYIFDSDEKRSAAVMVKLNEITYEADTDSDGRRIALSMRTPMKDLTYTNTDLVVVKDIDRGVNAQGIETDFIVGTKGGAEIDFPIKDDMVVLNDNKMQYKDDDGNEVVYDSKMLSRGDIILAGLDEQNQMKSMCIVFKKERAMQDQPEYKEWRLSYDRAAEYYQIYDDCYIAYAKVLDSYGSTIVYSTNGDYGEKSRMIHSDNNTKVYKLELDRGSVETANASDIVAGNEIVVRINGNNVREIFIIEK